MNQRKPGMVAAGGGMAGRMGGYGYSGAAPAQAAQGQLQAESGPSLEGKVRQIGAKTFYWKNKRWVDSSVTPDEDAKATVVTQLTDSYFRLARAQKAEYNQYLSQSEPITVKLDGTVYHVDPAPAEPTR